MVVPEVPSRSAAGWLSGVCYRAIAKKNELAGVICAGIVCPVVNTGLFVVGMMEVVRLVLRTAILVFLNSAFPFLLNELLHHLLGVRIAFSKKRIIVAFYFFTSGLYEYKFFSIIYNFA